MKSYSKAKSLLFLFMTYVVASAQSYYIVEPHDTLNGIASKTGVAREAVVKLNGGKKLQPGSYIQLPYPQNLSQYVAMLKPGALLLDPFTGKPQPSFPYLQLDPIGQANGFLRLRHFSGAEFIASKDDLLLIFSTPSYGRFLDAAFFKTMLQFYGTPYAYGGNDFATGVDCSFFVQAIFSTVGRSLPRVSAQQFRQGFPIRSDQLLGGDLVFFARTIEKVSHVGMYWGEGQFIHASSNGGVKFSSLYEKYYREHFVGARRIL